jgi:hypothetical protein
MYSPHRLVGRSWGWHAAPRNNNGLLSRSTSQAPNRNQNPSLTQALSRHSPQPPLPIPESKSKHDSLDVMPTGTPGPIKKNIQARPVLRRHTLLDATRDGRVHVNFRSTGAGIRAAPRGKVGFRRPKDRSPPHLNWPPCTADREDT